MENKQSTAICLFWNDSSMQVVECYKTKLVAWRELVHSDHWLAQLSSFTQKVRFKLDNLLVISL